MGMAGDQHWTVDPNWPASQRSNCTGDCHARFLLAVEEGVMLGAEGWSDDYDRPLGDPLGPAKYVAGTPATMTRAFSSGTKVKFTYDQEDGQVRIIIAPPQKTQTWLLVIEVVLVAMAVCSSCFCMLLSPLCRSQSGTGEIWWNGIKPPPPPDKKSPRA